MKKFLYKNRESFAVSFAIAFMMFIYEQLFVYACNIDDFWYDLSTLLPVILIEFILSFALVAGVLILVKQRWKKYFKPLYIFVFGSFLGLYIEGNYLSSFLPRLDGAEVVWGDFLVPKILSTAIWIIIFVVLFILLKKVKFKKLKKFTIYASLIICAMLTVSLISTLMSNDILETKSPVTATRKNIDNISKGKNFFVILLDCSDSRIFEQEVKKLGKESVFNDFTYFPDTMSMYPWTKLSIPQILTGELYLYKEKYGDYYTKALEKSPLMNYLEKNDYDINIYDSSIVYKNDDYYKFANITNELNIDYFAFVKEEARLTLFRYLPYLLKDAIHINNYDVKSSRLGDNVNLPFRGGDLNNYLLTVGTELETIDKNHFAFIHLDGAHKPFNTDYDMNLYPNNDGTYEMKMDAGIRMAELLLERIRKTPYYDDSIIIILADHGFNKKDRVPGRQNALLMVKGYNEKHEFTTSDKSMSFGYLQEMYQELLEGKKSNEILKNHKSGEERTYYLYSYDDPCVIKEQKTLGKAWETKKIKSTGVKYSCHDIK